MAHDGLFAFDPTATLQSGNSCAAGRPYAAPSIMTIIEMEGPLISCWITIDNDQTEEDILTFKVSDEALEAAAGTEGTLNTLYNTLNFCCAC